jgi:hypothetical protein
MKALAAPAMRASTKKHWRERGGRDGEEKRRGEGGRKEGGEVRQAGSRMDGPDPAHLHDAEVV